jgi:ATP-dependent helicase IRC3
MSGKVTIQITNLTCTAKGDLVILNRVREKMRYRHPNAWHMRAYMPRGWDGYIYLMSERGSFATGFLPWVMELLGDDTRVDILDNRVLVEPGEIPNKIKKFHLRKEQVQAIQSVVENYLGDIYFPRGVISAATNFGKSVTMAGIAGCYPELKSLILLNDGTLYKQMLTDMPKLFRDWGYCQGKNIKFGQVTVAMVQTLVNHLDRYRKELANVAVLLVDECDLSTSKTYKKVLKYTPNAFVRAGLSGTVFLRNLAKDRVKNNTIRGQFGGELFKIKNLELMELGYSTPVVVKINKGNDRLIRTSDYELEYLDGIVRNTARNKMWVGRVRYYLQKDIFPILIVAKFHEHVEELYRLCQNSFWPKYEVRYVHGDIPDKDRDTIIEGFRAGEFPVLISSMIVRRGQNMPLIRAILNTAGGDSPETPLQLIGRGVRLDDSKAKVYYEDALDMGQYLNRHSKHRINYYYGEGFKIIKLL